MNNTFDQWYASRYYGHPWEPSKQALREAWEAGAANPAINPVKMAESPDAITPETIYAAYPRKVGKQAALKAIAKAIKTVGAARLLSLVGDYDKAVSRWPEEDKKFIPHPATWFNQGRYDDDPKEWQRGKPAPKSQFIAQH